MNKPYLFFSCEHASNTIPREYRWAFQKAQKVLKTHRGWDMGALGLAKKFQKDFGGRLIAGTHSRLLCDLNRRDDNPNCFSQYSRLLSKEDRLEVLDHYHRPYRQAMHKEIDRGVQKKRRVMHFSVHSFTGRLYGKTRNADVGLLYDPSRPLEKALAQLLVREVHEHCPWIRVRCNYPYRGTADGAIPQYRKIFPASKYVGLEFEFNQSKQRDFPKIYKELRPCVARSLAILG